MAVAGAAASNIPSALVAPVRKENKVSGNTEQPSRDGSEKHFEVHMDLGHTGGQAFVQRRSPDDPIQNATPNPQGTENQYKRIKEKDKDQPAWETRPGKGKSQGRNAYTKLTTAESAGVKISSKKSRNRGADGPYLLTESQKSDQLSRTWNNYWDVQQVRTEPNHPNTKRLNTSAKQIYASEDDDENAVFEAPMDTQGNGDTPKACDLQISVNKKASARRPTASNTISQ